MENNEILGFDPTTLATAFNGIASEMTTEELEKFLDEHDEYENQI